MKILHINAGNLYGGVESFLVTLARSAALRPDMESAFTFCFPGRYSQELAAAGAPVFDLGAVHASRYWTVRQSRRRLRQILERESIDAVACHMPWNFAIYGPEVRRARKPLVFWAHGILDGRGWVNGWARRTRPDFAICNSQFSASFLPRLFPDTPSRVLYCPVAVPELPEADALALRRELGVDSAAVVIVQVSRMEAWKGHSLHLRALGELKDVPGWVCWMVGGAQRNEEQRYLDGLKKQAAELGVADRIRFLGQRKDVPRMLRAADIFCQPNEDPEPFGIVFIEALAAGLPVVTTRFGGATEIVTDQEGYLTPPGDHRALADCLGRLINSPEERRRLSRSGPSRARSLCDPASQMRRLHEILAGLVRDTTRPVTSHPAAH